MALDGLGAVTGFKLPFNQSVKPQSGWGAGPAFAGINPETKATPQFGQSIGEKPFDWHSLAKFDTKSPAIGGLGAETGNRLDLFA